MEGYVGEIRLFAGNFAPRGWAFCDGTEYNISNNEVIFSIISNIYGGDGRTTFKVPDLRGRVPVGTGQGAGLSGITLGQTGGAETATMTLAQMPMHTHQAMANISIPAFSEAGDSGSPADAVLGGLQGAYSTEPADTHIAPAAATGSLSNTGANMPFGIVKPILATNYIICLIGIYPPRSN